MRVVSLVPSVTESLLALGCRPVACTRFCEQPALPTVGGTKDPDLAAIVALAPDLVVMDDEENRREDADALVAAGVPIHVTSVHAVEDVAPTLAALAAACGLPPPDPWPPFPPPPVPAVPAFVPIWRDRTGGEVSWMAVGGGTYGSSLLEHVGVADVFGIDDGRYPSCDLAAVVSRRPAVVLAPSEPYPFGPRHVPELEAIAPVALVDGQDLFWWGTRTPAAMARLRDTVANLLPAHG